MEQNVVRSIAEETRFSFYYPPVYEINYVKEADLYGIYCYITDPKYAKLQTDTLRRLQSNDARKSYKASHFAYCLFSGTFGEKRTNEGLVQHSRLLCFDFDHVPDIEQVKNQLLRDPYFETLLLFRSPSGDGLKWVIGIVLEKGSHELWYDGVCNYLRITYGLIADTACRNVARACFLPHDPDCYIAPRLHREVQPIIEQNPELLNLMTTLNAIQIKVEDYDTK